MSTVLWFLIGIVAMLGMGYGAYKLVSWPSLGNLAVIIFNALVPIILKRKTPEEEKEDNEAYLENRVMPTKQHPHPDEGGHR